MRSKKKSLPRAFFHETCRSLELGHIITSKQPFYSPEEGPLGISQLRARSERHGPTHCYCESTAQGPGTHQGPPSAPRAKENGKGFFFFLFSCERTVNDSVPSVPCDAGVAASARLNLGAQHFYVVSALVHTSASTVAINFREDRFTITNRGAKQWSRYGRLFKALEKYISHTPVRWSGAATETKPRRIPWPVTHVVAPPQIIPHPFRPRWPARPIHQQQRRNRKNIPRGPLLRCLSGPTCQ